MSEKGVCQSLHVQSIELSVVVPVIAFAPEAGGVELLARSFLLVP
jgi:hypothetical protein